VCVVSTILIVPSSICSLETSHKALDFKWEAAAVLAEALVVRTVLLRAEEV
jgi:hypothetical protein